MSPEQPTIDVILPTYNGSAWVAEAIDSVLAQTYPKWLLTVIDDASTDGTPDLVARLADQDPGRIKLIRCHDNRRAAVRRMQVVERCSGGIIAFIDQDDRWLPRKLERQVARLAAEPRVDAVHTDAEHIDSGGVVMRGSADEENLRRQQTAYDRMSSNELCAALFSRNSIRLASAAIRRQAFVESGGFNVELFGGEDWEFWIRFASGHRIGHVAEPLLQRRVHATNTSERFRFARTYGLLDALEIVERDYPFLRPFARVRREQLLQRLIVGALDDRDFGKAREAVRSLLRHGSLTPMSALHAALGLLGPVGRQALGGIRVGRSALRRRPASQA